MGKIFNNFSILCKKTLFFKEKHLERVLFSNNFEIKNIQSHYSRYSIKLVLFHETIIFIDLIEI